MKCSYQFGSMLDQSIKTCKLDEVGTREGGVRFSSVFHSRSQVGKRVREMINSLTTHLKEETSEDIEHKVWCVTQQTHNREKKRPQYRGEAPHHCGRARSFDGEFGNESDETLHPGVESNTNDPFMKVMKLIQYLI